MGGCRRTWWIASTCYKEWWQWRAMIHHWIIRYQAQAVHWACWIAIAPNGNATIPLWGQRRQTSSGVNWMVCAIRFRRFSTADGSEWEWGKLLLTPQSVTFLCTSFINKTEQEKKIIDGSDTRHKDNKRLTMRLKIITNSKKLKNIVIWFMGFRVFDYGT